MDAQRTIDLQSFIAELDQFTEEQIPAAVGVLVRKTAGGINRECIRNTPVGNPKLWQRPAPPGYVGGHAKRNWQVTLGEASAVELPGIDESGSQAEADAESVLAELPDYPLVFIDNPLPYMDGPGSLNDGHSTQAPAGFIDAIVDRHAAQFVVAEEGGPE